MRNKFSQTNIAAIVPPTQRKKSEYQSFDRLVKWAEKSLILLDNTLSNENKRKELKMKFNEPILERIEKELSWIKNYNKLITELNAINRVVKEIEKDIKHNGLTSTTLINAKNTLTKLKSKTGEKLKNNILSKLHEQFNLMPEKNIILYSSDILESTFGKYKNRVSENPMASITNLILIIAAFTCNLTDEKVKDCMEKIKISDIKKWAEDKIIMSSYKQRKILLSG